MLSTELIIIIIKGDKMNKEMEVKKVTEPARATSLLPVTMYNSLADYVNEQKIFNISVGLRQAVAFFLENKTTKDN